MIQVRNESVEDFLSLLKEWKKLCVRFSLVKNGDLENKELYPFDINNGDDDDHDDETDIEDGSEIFEVAKILQICYGDPKKIGEVGLYFKVSKYFSWIFRFDIKYMKRYWSVCGAFRCKFFWQNEEL